MVAHAWQQTKHFCSHVLLEVRRIHGELETPSLRGLPTLRRWQTAASGLGIPALLPPSAPCTERAGRLVLRFPDSLGVGVEEPGSPGQRPVSRAPSGKRLPLHPLEPCLVSHRSPQMASLPPVNHQPKSRTLDSSHPPSVPSRLSWQTWTQRGAWARSTIGKTCPPPSCIWRPSVWRGASRRSPSSPAAWWWSRGNLWPPTRGPTGALPWKAR